MWAAACADDLHHPADPLCGVCWTRRNADDNTHQHMQIGHTGANIRRTTLVDMQNTGDDLARAFLAAALEPSWAAAWLPDTMDELGNISRPRNYVGFLHADGNRMGEHLRSFLHSLKGKPWIEAEDAYGAFSTAIAQATQQAVVQALHHVMAPPAKVKGTFVPFDPILSAGDDLVLLLAAHHALDVAARFCTVFESEMSAAATQLGYTGKMTTAVGVVLAHAKHPILQLQRQAKDLLRSAKARVADLRRRGKDVSAVDFEVVTTAVVRPLTEHRRHAYQLEDHNQGLCHLTRRPYTADDLSRLLDLGRQLKHGRPTDPTADPDSERRSYRGASCMGCTAPSSRGTIRRSYRAPAPFCALNSAQRSLLLTFAGAFDAKDDFPWSSNDEISTPVTDLVEIFDFLHTSISSGIYPTTTATRKTGEAHDVFARSVVLYHRLRHRLSHRQRLRPGRVDRRRYRTSP
ncbi:MAG: hypothetical protein R2856_23280 [Caldilineaceae bacterium]